MNIARRKHGGEFRSFGRHANAVPQLDAHQTAVAVNRLADGGHGPHVVLVPQRQVAEGKIVR